MDVITQYGEKLESDAELAQEEIDEMVEMFNEFNATIEEYLNG
jgi:exopolyphosphatase/pppGpp-phosphohydrolase